MSKLAWRLLAFGLLATGAFVGAVAGADAGADGGD
jgi:hypothetical protein